MDRYGCDKPDLRFGMEIRRRNGFGGGMLLFRFPAPWRSEGGKVRALNCKGCAEKFTRTTIETLTDHALGYGAEGHGRGFSFTTAARSTPSCKSTSPPAPVAGAAGPRWGPRTATSSSSAPTSLPNRLPHPVRLAPRGRRYAGPARQAGLPLLLYDGLPAVRVVGRGAAAIWRCTTPSPCRMRRICPT